ncbi:hypothetical protein GALMADRAFT_234106 [Galerina marginata CBS 339.88]|uniref:Pentacotripeptide-repeat region of PRORP domain-containing protein n=1 Tax=Galerina marginata (strain CBS 339.88) TaxID=685588 RepID=A0A067U1T0_GALM3|nr:hypothetical protein GALMADRAFT_234106 [Galerina marginata CBS 339.88]
MLKYVSNQNTLILLDSLVPSLVCRARAFSKPALKRNSGLKLEDAPIIHSKIRDQIMAQAHTRRKIPTSIIDSRNTSLAQLQKAVESRDVPAALKHWQDLVGQKATIPDEKGFELPESIERTLNHLVATHFLRERTTNSWSEDLKAFAENFALQAATHNSTDALHALMWKNLECNDPQATLDLYQKFCEMMEDTKTQVDEGLAFTDEETSEQYFHPGRISILLDAITAHAMNDSFRSALDIYLAANIRVRGFRRTKLFQDLKYNVDLQQKVAKYLDRLEIAALVYKPPSLSRHIMNLSHPRSARILEKLYNDIVDGINGPEAYLAADESGLSTTSTLAMTEIGWTSFQTAFIRSERTDLAAQMWDDLARCGIRPGVSMWTALLDTHADLRDSRQAMHTWNMMLRQDIKPDELSYRAIIAALFDDNKTEDALKRFKEYKKFFNGVGPPALTVYNTVLRGLLRLNLITEANSLMMTMLSAGPTPDVISFNTFLAFYGRQNDFKGLASIVTRMSDAKITGDVVTFSTILSALLQAGRNDAPNIIISLMQNQGVQPNVATYTAIIDHLMRQQTEASLKAALKLLDKMEQTENTRPNEVTYTSILSGLHRGQWVSRQRAEEVRREVVSRMRRFGIAFRLPTYHILIRAALESPDPKGYLDALALIQEMENQGVPRINTTWYILFAGLMRLGLWDVAREMQSRMYISGHVPTTSLVKLIDEIRRRTS